MTELLSSFNRAIGGAIGLIDPRELKTALNQVIGGSFNKQRTPLKRFPQICLMLQKTQFIQNPILLQRINTLIRQIQFMKNEKNKQLEGLSNEIKNKDSIIEKLVNDNRKLQLEKKQMSQKYTQQYKEKQSYKQILFQINQQNQRQIYVINQYLGQIGKELQKQKNQHEKTKRELANKNQIIQIREREHTHYRNQTLQLNQQLTQQRGKNITLQQQNVRLKHQKEVIYKQMEQQAKQRRQEKQRQQTARINERKRQMFLEIIDKTLSQLSQFQRIVELRKESQESSYDVRDFLANISLQA